MRRSVTSRVSVVTCAVIAVLPSAWVMAGVGVPGTGAAGSAAPAGAATATGCPANETCLLAVTVSDPTDPSCDYGCPTGDAIAVTATGTRTGVTGTYVPPTDFIVVYEVPTSGANCVGVVGTDNGCIEVQSCPVGQATCSITLSWNWNASYPGSTTTHVFEAWTINTAGNYPDYCSGKSWFQYSTAYLYPYLGSGQLGSSGAGVAGVPGAGIYETATSVPDGTPVAVRTYADDPPLYDSNFSTYQCTDDSNAPPGVAQCATQPQSYTYPNNQAFGTSSTSGYAGCNAATIPPAPGWAWPSPLTVNGPYDYGAPTTRYFITSQAVFITDPQSNNVACVGSSASQPQIGMSNWLAVSWYCPPVVAGLSAQSGSGQQAVDGTPFAQPLAASVVNSCTGLALPGSAVTFSVPPGAASFAGGATTETDVTGADGVAISSTVRAGSVPQAFVAQATDGGYLASYSLTDTCNPSWGSSVTAVSGTPQSALGGTPFAAPLVARVVNQCGAPLAGAQVTFTVPGPQASFSGGTSGQADDETTAADGTATSATVVAGTAPGSLGSYLGQATASFPGPFSPQGPVAYQLTNTCNPALPATMSATSGDQQQAPVGQPFSPLSVVVLNQCGGGWSGGTVTFTGPSAGSGPAVSFGAVGGSTTGTGVTDAAGATASPVPYGGAVPGVLTVRASVAPAWVAPVNFSLTVTPLAPGGGMLLLPTAVRTAPRRSVLSGWTGPGPGPGPGGRRAGAAGAGAAGRGREGHVRSAGPTAPTRDRVAPPRSPRPPAA